MSESGDTPYQPQVQGQVSFLVSCTHPSLVKSPPSTQSCCACFPSEPRRVPGVLGSHVDRSGSLLPLHCPALHAVVGLILAFCPGGLPGQVGSGQEVRTAGLQAPRMLTSFPVFHTSWPGVPQGLLSRRSKKGLKHPPGPLIERIQCKGVEGKSI